MKVKSESEVAQLCLTLRNPMDCSPPGSSVHAVFQARVLEWVAIAFSTRSSLVAQRKVSAFNAGDLGSIPGSGRFPEEGNGHPLQYSCWEIPWMEEPGGLQSMGSQRVGRD